MDAVAVAPGEPLGEVQRGEFRRRRKREREGSWREEKGGFIKLRESWDTGQG